METRHKNLLLTGLIIALIYFVGSILSSLPMLTVFTGWKLYALGAGVSLQALFVLAVIVMAPKLYKFYLA